MTALDRKAKAWSDAKLARKSAPRGYRMRAQARLELATVELLRAELRRKR